MKILKRIKRAYKALTTPSFEDLEVDDSVTNVYLEPDENGNFPIKRSTYPSLKTIEGDGKAVFFGEGTTEEFEEQKRKDSGEDKWYNRIKNLI